MMMFKSCILVSATVVLTLLADSCSGQSTTTINCYACTGQAFDTSGFGNVGCAYPFNATSQTTVPCPGMCTTLITRDTSANFDTVVRGCTIVDIQEGCNTLSTGSVVCAAACKTNLCNGANSNQVIGAGIVLTASVVSLITVVFRRI